jgi:hypothetical protein
MHPLEIAEEQAPSTGLELRNMRAELERAEEAAARRAHEAHLETMLRREIRAAVTAEVSALRAEIAQLRSELLEKVGGQLRLERIETTRVIGSDLEALQHEVRQLKAVTAQEAELGPAARARAAEAVRQIVEPARVRPVTRQTAEVEADVQPARAAAESRPPSPPVPVETTGPIQEAAADPSDASQPQPQPQPRPQPAATPEPVVLPLPATPRPASDEFAGLPRIRPFTEFELDPIEPAASDDAAYTGRRRRADEAEPGAAQHTDDDETGRRHRRAEDSEDDLLARLLAREGH